MAEIIKDCTEKYQLVFSDNYIAYQETTKKGLFSKERVITAEARIPYSNVAYIEFNKNGGGTGFCRQLEVVIGLKVPQREFASSTVSVGFDGCYMFNEIQAAENLVNSKIR